MQAGTGGRCPYRRRELAAVLLLSGYYPHT
jgi:hypothetical protein